MESNIYGIAALIALAVVIFLILIDSRRTLAQRVDAATEELRQRANDPAYLDRVEPIVSGQKLLIDGGFALIDIAIAIAPANLDERLLVARELLKRASDGLPNDAYPEIPKLEPLPEAAPPPAPPPVG